MFTHTHPTHFSGPDTVPSKSFYPGLSSFAAWKWLNRIPLFLSGGRLGVVCLFSRLARLYGNRRLYLSQCAVCTGGKHGTECTILRVPGQSPPVPSPKCQISVPAVNSIVSGCLSPVPLLFQTWFLWGERCVRMLWADGLPQKPGSVVGIFHVRLIAGTRDSNKRALISGGPE